MSPVGRTALVLAGGGVSGAVYEIGALRAIDDLLVNRTVNDFDIYVGTSAGALVAAFLANGVSSTDLMRVVSDAHPLARSPKRNTCSTSTPAKRCGAAWACPAGW